MPKPKIATPDATTITITSPRFQELSTITIVSFDITVVELTTGTTVAVCTKVIEAVVVVVGTTVTDAVVVAVGIVVALVVAIFAVAVSVAVLAVAVEVKDAVFVVVGVTAVVVCCKEVIAALNPSVVAVEAATAVSGLIKVWVWQVTLAIRKILIVTAIILCIF